MNIYDIAIYIWHTHTQTHSDFYGLQELSIGVMVFKTVFYIAVHNPTPKPTPYRKLSAFLDFSKDSI